MPYADPITPYLEPKPAGGTRTMARLSSRDDAVWRGLAARVADAIEPRLDPSVLAHRTSRTATGIRFRGFTSELRRARRLAAGLAQRAEVVIRTDIRAFYPSVTPAVAHRSLQRTGVGTAVAGRVAGMLENWGSEGYAGLPIGPPGSAVIANAVMAGIDAELAGSPFLRWVDDYVIGVRDERQADHVLERLDASLERIGLERSESKTLIVGGGPGFVWPGTYLRP